MARNDGIDRTVARHQDIETADDLAKVQEHNEREKDSYSNQDIVPERSSLNIHFKEPTAGYEEMFTQMEQDKVISTRGLKADAVKYGGNRAMSEALGEDVYHYHLHVVYIPVVEKQILWSKRCKDEALRGTVKETIMQVSRSKKWESKPVLDGNGNPMLNTKGKKILKSSYSVLQDDFFNFMQAAGYTDVERGERGSTEEHLTVTQFKVQAETQRLEAVTARADQAEQALADTQSAVEKQEKKLKALQKETKTAKTVAVTVQDIEAMGKKNSFTGNVTLTADQCDTLKRYATNGIIFNAENERLKEKLASAVKSASIWKQRHDELNEKYKELKEKAQPYLDALEIAAERVRAFLSAILARGKETREHKAPARKHGRDMEI